MQAKIAAHYPGTRLSISEYNYGAGGDISGGLAEADALGVFGREDLYAACMWEMSADNSFIMGALNMFTDFDGAGGHFLDRSIHADSSDVARATVYASYNNTDDMVLVAINKTDTPLDAAISYSYPVPPGSAKAWQLTAASATPQPAPNPDMWQQPTIRYTLPPMSVTTITSPAIH